MVLPAVRPNRTARRLGVFVCSAPGSAVPATLGDGALVAVRRVGALLGVVLLRLLAFDVFRNVFGHVSRIPARESD